VCVRVRVRVRVRGCAVACFYCVDCPCYIYLFAVVRHSFDCCTEVVLSKLIIILCGVVLRGLFIVYYFIYMCVSMFFCCFTVRVSIF